MIRIRYSILILLLTLLLTSCNEKDKDSLDQVLFGPELYNASYISLPGEIVEHVIPIMSKIDLSDIVSYDIKYSGGQVTYSCSVENTEYDLDDYHLYRLIIDFTAISFTDNLINVEKIIITTDDSNTYEIIPDKCEIAKYDGEFNGEYLNINGSPLRIPSSMQSIPLELSADEEVEISKITVFNTSFKINSYKNLDSTITDEFKQFKLNKNQGIKTWSADFTTEADDLAKYKQYCTSIVIEYTKNKLTFYTTATVPRTIYNPFDPDYESIQPYYEYLLGE